MKIGLSIPPTIESPDHFYEWVRRVDAGPFSTLSVLDRVVYSNFEPLVTLAALDLSRTQYHHSCQGKRDPGSSFQGPSHPWAWSWWERR